MASEPWLMQGDCLDRMKEIPDGSVDAIITDPPYPCIKRKYGYWTEEAWHLMMRGVVTESRRVLKPHGSAVFILQPNSEKIGRMRPWLWEFMAWTSREWNQVQDAWWWNDKALPEAHSIQGKLLRPSLKACVWLGSPACYRNQDDVLWEEADSVKLRRKSEQCRAIPSERHNSPGGHGVDRLRRFESAQKRGGVSPYNVIIANHGYSQTSAGSFGHGAGTPYSLADWWVRYISKPGDTVCDPFMGTGTIPMAALTKGRNVIGIEKFPEYFEISSKRISGNQPGVLLKPARKTKAGTIGPLLNGFE